MPRNSRISAVVIGLLVLVMARDVCSQQPAHAARAVEPVTDALREKYALDPFYKKLVNADGLLILSSDRVPDEGLVEAAYLIDQVLKGRDDIRAAIAKSEIRIVIMNQDEFTTDVPEHARLGERGGNNKDWWDRRARGLGARGPRSAMSCGVENLLQYKGDPYSDENILIHEFAHTVDDVGLAEVDPAFEGKLKDCYEKAMAEGLWKTAYATTNQSEYWAEIVQVWFFCNPPKARHDHIDINTRAELKEYDPRAYALLEYVFGDNDYQYAFPRDREQKAHLAQWDFDQAPAFAWPDRLKDINTRGQQRPPRRDAAPQQDGQQTKPSHACPCLDH